jgi:TRAP-type C4-dicarboxylate transport system permease small subunit
MIERINRFYGRILHALGLVAGATTFLMMLLVVCNVVSRFAFNKPVEGTLEITESALTVLIFLALAMTQHEGGHIKVVLLTQRLPARLARWAEIAALTLGALFFAWATYAAWGFAQQSLAINEHQWGAINYPMYPVKFVIFGGLLLLCGQYVLDALRVIANSAPATTDGSAA